MKRILIALLAVVILTIVWLLLPEDQRNSTMHVLTNCSAIQRLPQYPALYEEGEQALHDEDLPVALHCIEQGKREARDSSEYYRYEVLQAKYYFSTMKTDSFLLCNKRLGQYLSKLPADDDERQLLEVEYEMQLGVYEAKMVGRMDSAQYHNMRAFEMMKSLPWQHEGMRLVLLTNIADAYKQMGKYDESVRYFCQAMELGDSLGMSDATRIALAIGVASAYTAMGNFEQSAQRWQLVAQMKPKMGRADLFHYLNNRGNDFFLQENYTESLKCFLELDSLLTGDPNMVWELMFCHCNLSDVYIKLGRPGEARRLVDETERFFTQEHQPVPLYYLATQRIELAIVDGRLPLAQQLAAQNVTPQWMIPEQKLLRQKVLLKLYEQTGQWKLYATALEEANQLQAAITDGNMKMRFSTALMQYEHEEQLLDKQRLIEEKELSLRWFVALLVAAAIVIVLLIIILAMKQRERKLKELEMRSRITGLRMETVRNRITPHFISNALAAEMLAQMNGEKIDLETLVQLLHRGIELTGTEQTSLADELAFISFYCNIESRSIGPDFKYEAVLASDVDADQIVLPSMSVQILVENALKHGLKARRAQPGQNRSVLVKVSRQKKGTLVEVLDNGVGLPEGQPICERTGLKVVRQTVLMLNEQHVAEAGTAGSDDDLMGYALENRTDGVQGCRGWIYLPDGFNYILNTNEHGK